MFLRKPKKKRKKKFVLDDKTKRFDFLQSAINSTIVVCRGSNTGWWMSMSGNEEHAEYTDSDSSAKAERRRFRDKSKVGYIQTLIFSFSFSIFFIWFQYIHYLFLNFVIWVCFDFGSNQRKYCPNKPLRSPNVLKNTKASSTRWIFYAFWFIYFGFFCLFHRVWPFGYVNIETSFDFDVCFLPLSINAQVTHLVGVLGFGGFCFLLGASKLINLTF